MTIHSISSKQPILNNRKFPRKVNQTKGFELFEEVKQGAISNEAVNVLANINPFLIFNEACDEEKEREYLKQSGGKMLDCLKTIRLGLLNGDFEQIHLENLNLSFSSITYEFQIPEIRQLIEEIKTRVAVEFAKLEQNLSK